MFENTQTVFKHSKNLFESIMWQIFVHVEEYLQNGTTLQKIQGQLTLLFKNLAKTETYLQITKCILLLHFFRHIS